MADRIAEGCWFLVIGVFCFAFSISLFLLQHFLYQQLSSVCETCSEFFYLWLTCLFILFSFLFIFLAISAFLHKSLIKVIAPYSIKLFFISFFLLSTVSALFSEQIFMDDSYSYFLVAKFSWLHPSILLDRSTIATNKPLFILLASPFAQFGLFSFKLFNVIVSLLTCVVLFFTAKRFNLSRPYVTPIVTALSPFFFLLSFSGLSHTLFAFLLSLSLYFYAKQNFCYAAFLLSLLPLCRPEGFVLLLVFALYFIFKKRFGIFSILFSTPFLANAIGFIFTGNIFWLISNPYVGLTFYGSGPLSFFFEELVLVTGAAGFLFFQMGFYSSLKHKQFPIVFHICFLSVFLLHSIIYFLGTFGSAGFTNDLITVLPIIAILTNYGFNYFLDQVNKKETLTFFLLFVFEFIVLLSLNNSPRAVFFYFVFFIFSILLLVFKLSPKAIFSFNVFLSLFLLVTFIPAFILAHPPQALSTEHKTLKSAVAWLTGSEFIQRPLYCGHPYFYVLIGEDPFKASEYGLGKPNKKLKYGTIIVWEPHYGPRSLNLNALKNNIHLLKSFALDKSYKVEIFEVR